jgi:hypothetical protein
MRPNAKRTVLALAVAVIAVAAAVVWVTPGGTNRFDPRAYRGRMGKIVVPFKGESVLYLLKDKMSAASEPLELRTKNGTFTAPVGSFQPYVYYAVVRHNGRITWTAKSQLYRHKRIIVKANTTQQLAVGPPLDVSMEAHQQPGKTVYMTMESLGRGGEDCTIEQSGTATGEPPSFQVISKAGKVVWSGKFRYG